MAAKTMVAKKKPKRKPKPPLPDVLTLDEAAAYLRVPADRVRDLATRAELPGQPIGDEWRFLKVAMDDWLRNGLPKKKLTPTEILLSQAGALADDESIPALIEWLAGDRGEPQRVAEAG